MTRVFRALAFLPVVMLAVSIALPAQKGGKKDDRPSFRGRSADSYPARDAHDALVVAAEPYDTPDEVREAFGKNDPNRAGILPILLVITNTGDKAIRLDDMKIEFITDKHQKIEPTSARDVAVRMRKKVDVNTPIQTPKPRLPSLPGIGGGNSDRGIDVLANAFEMRMVVPQSTAVGFLYFDVASQQNVLSGAKLYLAGMKQASNGQELMFFEVELEKALPKVASGK